MIRGHCVFFFFLETDYAKLFALQQVTKRRSSLFSPPQSILALAIGVLGWFCPFLTAFARLNPFMQSCFFLRVARFLRPSRFGFIWWPRMGWRLSGTALRPQHCLRDHWQCQCGHSLRFYCRRFSKGCTQRHSALLTALAIFAWLLLWPPFAIVYYEKNLATLLLSVPRNVF